jgi:glycosyltransferase involved in cell wall biosynthesis
MGAVPETFSYALVTPARNEAENLHRLSASLAEQTVMPAEWVIVDDGSTDGTWETAEALSRDAPWIRVLASPGPSELEGPLGQGRRTGRDIVAFKAGVDALRARPDVVVKLDADVSFAPDYFERLLGELVRDPSLGITGGVCWELRGGEWRPYHVTGGHVRGATRAYRWACFEDVSPLEEQIGWDGVDEVKARLRGWTTRSIDELAFYHHRNLGTRDGARGAWELQGELAHYMGHRAWYVFLRAVFRSRHERAAIWMIPAYARCVWRRTPRYPDAAVRDYVRSQQSIARFPLRAREALGWRRGDAKRERPSSPSSPGTVQD